jgi:hypothetical protein
MRRGLASVQPDQAQQADVAGALDAGQGHGVGDAEGSDQDREPP